ncbi:LAFE_0F05820g1_1 [Lachancea fermentati]|uniref:Spindle pole body component n=1 Tax=Lachancea fermentati TaxID=4955 RepID=A0A1G4MET1_LACFM|nr:LAFE_0F05820g1_1 [Lachancea fermentati]
MDIKSNLNALMGSIAPLDLPPTVVQSLQDRLLACIDSPRANSYQLLELIEHYKERADHSVYDSSRWQKLEALAQFFTTARGREEISRYLTFMKMMIDETPQRKDTKQIDAYLDKTALNDHDNIIPSTRPPSTYAESFENIDKFSDRRSNVSGTHGRHPLELYNASTLSSLADPYYSNMVSTEEIMKSIPFTLVATTSSLFAFNNDTIQIPSNITNGESGVLHLLFEAGLLYQSLQMTVDKQKHTTTLSPLKISFLSFTSAKLQNYVIFLNRISHDIQKSTIRSIYRVIYHQILEFRVYFRLLKRFDQTRGDEYLSQFNALRHHGDPLISSIGSELFDALITLYHEYIINWLLHGQLGDLHSEFFIENVTEPEPHNMNLRLLRDRIPDFIPFSIAGDIFMIGKTYLFLEKYCGDIQWVDDFSRKYAAKYDGTHVKLIEDIFDIIHSQFIEIKEHCNEVLQNKFYLYDVLKALKNMLLMGRSDFIEVMIQNSESLLRQPSNSLASYRLTRCLQDSVRQSSLRSMINSADQNYVINGLDARVLELGHGSTGWDVFTLDYVLEPPLSLVLNVNRENGKKEYLRVFNFLWRIKKNSYFFQKEWLRQNSLMRDFKKIRRNRPLVKDILNKMSKVNVIRNRLQSFNAKIEAFCFQSIIHKNYKSLYSTLMSQKDTGKKQKIIKLKNGLNVVEGILKPNTKMLENFGKAKSSDRGTNTFTIDNIASIHNRFLQDITCHRLLDSISLDRGVGKFTKQYYPTMLIILLGDINDFISKYSEFNDKVHEMLIQLSLQTGDEIQGYLSNFNKLLNDIVMQYKGFQNQSYLFIRDLKADGNDELELLSRLFR